MTTDYSNDRPTAFIMWVWEVVESWQEKYPYYEFGWDGFAMILILRNAYNDRETD